MPTRRNRTAEAAEAEQARAALGLGPSRPRSNRPSRVPAMSDGMAAIGTGGEVVAVVEPRPTPVTYLPPSAPQPDPLGVAILTGDHTALGLACPKCTAPVQVAGHPATPYAFCTRSKPFTGEELSPCGWGDQVFRWSDGSVRLGREPDGQPVTVRRPMVVAEPLLTEPVRLTEEEQGRYGKDPIDYDEVQCGTFTLTPEEAATLTERDERLIPLGNALRAARHGAGKTMGEVAAELGVSVVWVSDVERGRTYPDSHDFGRFVDALDLDDSEAIWLEWLRVGAAPDSTPVTAPDALRKHSPPMYFSEPYPLGIEDAVLGRLIAPVRPMIEDVTEQANGGDGAWKPLDIPDLAMTDEEVLKKWAPTIRPLVEELQQTSANLCDRCGWRFVVPDTGCLNCDRAAACLADPVAAAEVYRAVVSGRAKVAEWSGNALVGLAGQEVARIYPLPNGGWAGRLGSVIEERDTEGEARAWVESACGWSVLPMKVRK